MQLWPKRRTQTEDSGSSETSNARVHADCSSARSLSRRKRKKSWFRRTVEIGKLQVQQDDKLKWLEEAYRQMGERLVDQGFPDEEEFETWLHFVRDLRSEIAWLQTRILELENPERSVETTEDTRPIQMIAGGAVASQNDFAQAGDWSVSLHSEDSAHFSTGENEHRAVDSGSEHSHYEILNPISAEQSADS